MKSIKKAKSALILAVPETAGSALYGMVDVLSSVGNLWETLTRAGDEKKLIETKILSQSREIFCCGNGVPVQPAVTVSDNPKADILILPELWLGPDEDISGRYPELMKFINKKHEEGSYIYSACSGAIMLAETGLLDGRPATSHWGYADLFRDRYPQVQFNPEPNLVFSDSEGRIVTAGGTTSWHDLAIHIIARHCSPGEALRIAKVYLLKWHSEGQLPYVALVRNHLHADSIVRSCEDWLTDNFRRSNCIKRVIEIAGIPERTLKRRFKAATGSTLISYIQNLRVEEAKQMLETETTAVDEISAEIGYEEPAFFRRLFKRSTGLTPSQYRKMFRPVAMHEGL